MNISDRQGRTRIRQLLERYDVRARKSIGQHFLADPNVVDRIVKTAAIEPNGRVLEVGAGTGTLTAALARTGTAVVAYEIDERLRPILKETVGNFSNVELRFADVLEVDLEDDLSPGSWVLVANLPYYIGVRLLITVLRTVPTITRAVVMLQKEVADRLLAKPAFPEYGLSSVTVSLRARVRRAFNVSSGVFFPLPEVESSVVVVERIQESAHADRADVLATTAFNQRRKMLRRSLKSVLSEPSRILESAGLDPEARAEDLSVSDYIRLAEVVGN